MTTAPGQRAGAPLRVATIAVMVALVGFAGFILMRPVPVTTTTATVTSTAADAVCLDVAASGPLCLDREHIDHLDLGGLRAGGCVDVSYQGRLVVDESLTRVTSRSC